MKKALIAAALLFGCTGQALAVGSVADVTVYDRAENRTLPVHYHEGRYYVVGKPGNECRVDIRNHQPGEILTVISVDGINAVSGEVRCYVNLPPEKWLEQIEELRKQGRLEEAKMSLAHFQQRYLDYLLPASLKNGIKP